MRVYEYRFPRMTFGVSPVDEKNPSKTVWKLLRAGQLPHYQPRHRRVDERCLANTEFLGLLTWPYGRLLTGLV